MPFPKQRVPKGNSSKLPTEEYKITDPRFSKLETDPRFKLPSRKRTHTKLDKRFDRILKDEEFTQKASVDRYGRPLNQEAGKKEMQRLYEVASASEDEDEDEQDEEADDDEIVQNELRRAGQETDEESEDEEELEMVELDEEADYEEEEQGEGIPTGEVSSRLACVNLDWDNIRSVDLMAVAASFAPPSGKILSVTVYPSEFGRERMEREEMEGPPKELFKDSKPQAEESDSEEDSDVDSEEEDERVKNDLLKEDKGDELNSTALRAYQLDRLKYYYAIINCSSDVVAKKLYDEMDGREYLSSANFFDLRFVPDEVTFDETPRDACTEVPRDYRPTEFVTEALTHSNVKLTWDADDKQRKEVQKRAFSRKEIDDNDLQAYIGSASESEESEEDEIAEEEDPNADMMSVTSKSTKADKRDLLRAALGLPVEVVKSSRKDVGKPKGPIGNMQVSFTPGLSAVSATSKTNTKASVFENDPRDVEESTMERYVRKERERKARRKERTKARREGRDPDLVGESANEAAEPAVEAAAQEEEAGFDDPFFTDPLNADRESKNARKAEKAKLRAEKQAEEAAEGTKREELELLMAGEEDSIRHFDMREIKKQEKAKKMKGKKKNKGKAEDEAATSGEAFKIDTQDARFSALFDNHEFAIDPTNPKFKKTEGMNAIMEEGRKKRAAVRDEDDAGRKVTKKAKLNNGGDDLKRLVEKVKKKAKAN